MPERNIRQNVAELYGVWKNDRDEYVLPFFDVTGKVHTANQFRTVANKGFMIQGDWAKSGLFGQQLWPAGCAKQITLVEGGLDALAACQMTWTDKPWPVVAVKSAGQARKDVVENFEYLNAFDKIVVCFDKDDEHRSPDGTVTFPGQDAALKVAALFPLGKVRLMTLRKAKDPCDYLKNGWIKEFQDEWWNAPDFVPSGLKLAKNLWDEVRSQDSFESVSYPWSGLQELTYGLRTSEVVLLKADTGVGKTSVVKEIGHHILKTSDKGLGLLLLEESNKNTLLGLMSISANKPLHLPDIRNQVEEAELKRYFDDVCSDERVVVWDHFGSNSIESVLQTIRHMAALGCRYIILDHMSIVVSDQSGDERKQLDEISTKLKTMCMELDICAICVIHINRQGQVRGSAGPEQIANIVINLTRDKLADDEDIRNTTKVTVEKNRFCGRTGPACALKYDAAQGRLMELPMESLEEFLARQNKKSSDDEEW